MKLGFMRLVVWDKSVKIPMGLNTKTKSSSSMRVLNSLKMIISVSIMSSRTILISLKTLTVLRLLSLLTVTKTILVVSPSFLNRQISQSMQDHLLLLLSKENWKNTDYYVMHNSMKLTLIQSLLSKI